MALAVQLRQFLREGRRGSIEARPEMYDRTLYLQFCMFPGIGLWTYWHYGYSRYAEHRT